MCMVRFSFLKSRLIPGDETTMCNGKGVEEGTRQGKREVMVVLLWQSGQ